MPELHDVLVVKVQNSAQVVAVEVLALGEDKLEELPLFS